MSSTGFLPIILQLLGCLNLRRGTNSCGTYLLEYHDIKVRKTISFSINAIEISASLGLLLFVNLPFSYI